MDIAADYAATTQEIQHLVSEWRAYNQSKGRDMVKFEREVKSTPETMHTFLTHIRTTYGSGEAYLRQCGIMDSTIAQLQEKFLAW